MSFGTRNGHSGPTTTLCFPSNQLDGRKSGPQFDLVFWFFGQFKSASAKLPKPTGEESLQRKEERAVQI